MKGTFIICLKAVLSILLTMSTTLAQSDIDYGEGYTNALNNSESTINRRILSIVSSFYGLSKQGGKVFDEETQVKISPVLKLYGYNEISDDRYLVYFYVHDTKKILNGIQEFPFELTENWHVRPMSSANISLAIVDLNDETVKRILLKGNSVFSSLLLSSGGRYSSGRPEVYGCIQGYPTILADVNGDSIKDILFVGGSGAIFLPSQEVNAKTDMYLFLGPNFDNKPIKAMISEERFNFYFDSSGDVYQVVRDQIGQRLVDYGNSKEFIRGTSKNLRPGYRNFSKIFWGLQSDGVDQILVWGRNYISRKKTDSKKGFKFESQNFQLYEIRGNSIASRKLGDEDGHSFLKKNKLSWKQGFPNKNKCENEDLESPVILNYGREELSVIDEVLDN